MSSMVWCANSIVLSPGYNFCQLPSLVRLPLTFSKSAKLDATARVILPVFLALLTVYPVILPLNVIIGVPTIELSVGSRYVPITVTDLFTLPDVANFVMLAGSSALMLIEQ